SLNMLEESLSRKQTSDCQSCVIAHIDSCVSETTTNGTRIDVMMTRNTHLFSYEIESMFPSWLLEIMNTIIYVVNISQQNSSSRVDIDPKISVVEQEDDSDVEQELYEIDDEVEL
ncbi:32536_t:CDS:2, partial [Racocetra persica]